MCAATPPLFATLPMDLTAPSMARMLVAQAACATHQRHVLDDARLLVSELVANAVLYGAPPLRLRIECDGPDGSGGLVVWVGDSSVQQPLRRVAVDDDERGRGLSILDLVSDTWGVMEAEDGKTVWFRLNSAQ